MDLHCTFHDKSGLNTYPRCSQSKAKLIWLINAHPERSRCLIISSMRSLLSNHRGSKMIFVSSFFYNLSWEIMLYLIQTVQLWTVICQTLVWLAPFSVLNIQCYNHLENKANKGSISRREREKRQKGKKVTDRERERELRGQHTEKEGERLRFHVFREYILRQVSTVRVKSFIFPMCWFLGYHDNPSLQLSADEVQHAERERDITHSLFQSISLSVYQYLPVSLSLSLSITVSLNSVQFESLNHRVHWHDKERIHCIVPKNIQRIKTNNGTRHSCWILNK